MAYKYIIPWVMMAQCSILVTTINAGKVPAIIVFGDSSVEAGNNNFIPTISRCNWPPYGRDFPGGKPTGRFCNGRIPPDFISEAFGLKPTVPPYLDPKCDISDFADGVSFASSSSGFDTATSNLLRVLSTWKQVELYKDYQKKLRGHVGEKKANYIISEALYVISMGTNDFLSNYYLNPIVQARYSIDQYQNFIIGIIENLLRELHNLGARKIAVVGLPPMGCLPLERSTNIFRLKGDTCVEKYNMVAMSFNSQLNTLLQKLNKEVPGIRLVYANSYDLLWDYIHDPAKYGFENTGRACCATGRFELSFLCNELDPTTCQDASKFVFWDSFHPTEKTNRLIAETLAKTGLKQFF